MSRDDLYSFFITLLTTVSAARIAEATGYTEGAISQVKNKKYKADDSIVLNAIFAKFGRWYCPSMGGEIDLKKCRTEMAQPYSAGRIKQWAACQQCERRN